MTKSEIAELVASKVAPLYNLMGWTWGESEQSPPSREIEDTVQDLIDSLTDIGVTEVSTGRLSVERWDDEVDGPSIRVSLDLYQGPMPEEN